MLEIRRFVIVVEGLPDNTTDGDVQKALTLGLEKVNNNWIARKLLPQWLTDILRTMKILSVIDAP